MKQDHDKLRAIPSVEILLQTESVKALLSRHSRRLVLDAIHTVLDTLRDEIRAGGAGREGETSIDHLVPRIENTLQILSLPRLRRVINATGVVIHTNLGRSPLTEEMMGQVVSVASHYSNLEYNLAEGKRGSRYSHVEELLCRMTGAEAALVVNNNAGAVLLGLNTLAEEREVIVSRGQLVEIGGSFRIPDVMNKSGCTLVEVGTTNKTHPKDYENAITARTGCILKVHMSNFEMRGFTREVSHKELLDIARKHQLPLMEDLGSGSLIDLSSFGLRKEPTVQESVRWGVDLITFSGDKLLGGPQAGILVGKKEILDRLKRNPLTRALRVDKMTLAALEVTLRMYLDPEQARQELPTLRMLTLSSNALKERAERLASALTAATGETLIIEVREDRSEVGGGALPEASLPTFVVTVQSRERSVNQLEEAFRGGDPPVIGRIQKDLFLLDVRTIFDHEIDEVVAAARDAVGREI